MNTIDEMRDYIIFYKVSTRRGWKQKIDRYKNSNFYKRVNKEDV